MSGSRSPPLFRPFPFSHFPPFTPSPPKPVCYSEVMSTLTESDPNDPDRGATNRANARKSTSPVPKAVTSVRAQRFCSNGLPGQAVLNRTFLGVGFVSSNHPLSLTARAHYASITSARPSLPEGLGSFCKIALRPHRAASTMVSITPRPVCAPRQEWLRFAKSPVRVTARLHEASITLTQKRETKNRG